MVNRPDLGLRLTSFAEPIGLWRGFQRVTVASQAAYHGEGGTEENPVPFGLRVADIGSEAVKTVNLTDVWGNEHVWNPAADGDWFPDVDHPVLVAAIRPGTTVAALHVYLL